MSEAPHTKNARCRSAHTKNTELTSPHTTLYSTTTGVLNKYNQCTSVVYVHGRLQMYVGFGFFLFARARAREARRTPSLVLLDSGTGSEERRRLARSVRGTRRQEPAGWLRLK